MKYTVIRLVVCMLAVCLLFGAMSPALAAPSLNWQTDNVYFDSYGRLVIEGYFYNDGTRTINWVNWFQVRVYLRQQNTNWWLHASTTYNNFEVYLLPGDSVRWTFRISGVDYAYFDYWNVKWEVNYRYR